MKKELLRIALGALEGGIQEAKKLVDEMVEEAASSTPEEDEDEVSEEEG